MAYEMCLIMITRKLSGMLSQIQHSSTKFLLIHHLSDDMSKQTKYSKQDKLMTCFPHCLKANINLYLYVEQKRSQLIQYCNSLYKLTGMS